VERLSRFCCLLALGLAACRPANRFPIAIFDVNEPGLIKAVRQAGFDAIHTSVQDPVKLAQLAKEAKKQGIEIAAFPQQLLAQDAKQTRGWPVLAWFLVDEPDVQGYSKEKLQDLVDKVKRWDPARTTSYVIGQGAPAKKFAGIGDALMLDWYPVPHLDMASVGEQLDIARRYWPKPKPLWMVMQAFDWRDSSQRDPKKPRIGRFPEAFEMRFMAYNAILHDATGLFFYRMILPEGKTLLDQPENWARVSKVAQELRAMQPILEGGKRKHLPFPPNPDGPETRCWRYLGRDYVIILNPKGKFHQRVPDELLAPRWRPLFEARRDQRDLLGSIRDAYYLKPYQVLVLESRLF
jgi:hypothetical protein